MIKAKSYLTGLSYSLAFNILSKGLLFFTNLLIAYSFGASSVTDLYFYILSIILLVANFVIGINGSVIIPESRRIEYQAGRSATFGFVNLMFLLLFAALLVTCLVLSVFPTEILSLVSNFDEEVLQKNKRLIHLSTLLFFVQIVVSFFNDLLVYYRYFILPSIITCLNGIATVVIVLLFRSKIGIESVLVGSILAYVASLGLQFFILLKSEKWYFFELARKIERRTFFNALYSVASITVSILVSFIPLYFLSTYAAGAITQLVLAQRIAEIPNTLLAIQFVTIIGVQFTEKYMGNNLTEFNQSFLRAASILQFVLIHLSVAVFFLSQEIVSILLEHGAIGKQAADIDDVLAILMIGVPFTGMNYLTSKALIAAQKIKASFYFNLVLSIINIVLSYIGIYLAAQIGYAWAISIYAATYFLFCFFLLRRTLPFIQYEIMIKSFFIFLLLNTGLMFCISHLYTVFFSDDFPILKILLTGTFHVGSILILNHFLVINSDVKNFIVNLLSKGRSDEAK